MYVVSVPMPDSAKEDFLNAFCDKFKYPTEVLDDNEQLVPNPTSKEDFVQDRIADWMLEVTKSYLLLEAEKAARAEAEVQVDQRVQDLNAWYTYLKEHGEEPPES